MTGTSGGQIPVSRELGGNRLGLNERLAIISLLSEEARRGASHSPLVGDLFDDLWNLVDATVSGAKIDRLHPEGTRSGSKFFEISSSNGESLGRLNLLYLNKPIPCYYLVYVEVATPFRNKGLGNLVLKAFRDFLIEKSSVGILDNIIPRNDPTFDVYSKLDWKPVETITEIPVSDASDCLYMIYVPPALVGRGLKDPVLKLMHHLRRKRTAIEMRENEFMVLRTIEEFKDLYSALGTYFSDGLGNNDTDPLMRYMFTRFVTKLLGFRRRIGRLLGYTGGESLDQIAVDASVRELAVQSYAPRWLADKPSFVAGDRELWLHLPEVLKNHPARVIESLPNYGRPSLMWWLKEVGRSSTDTLSIGDLLELGFDPTRLKEITLETQDFIFERVQLKMLGQVQKKMDILERIGPRMEEFRIDVTRLQSNPPLLIIRDRGNGYVLRRKVPGIHWEEAVEQLRTDPALKNFNAALGADKTVGSVIGKASDLVTSLLDTAEQTVLDPSNFFVSWNLESNHPIMSVDVGGASPETVWIA
ncbi:MAG: hypothetical protein WCG29_05325 [Desulfomonile sp.]